MVKLLEKGDFYFKITKVSILLLLCAVARGAKEKERTRFIVNLLIRRKETLQNNLAQLEGKEKETQEKLSKLNQQCHHFSFFFVFVFSLSGKFWPQLVCEYGSFAFLAYV